MFFDWRATNKFSAIWGENFKVQKHKFMIGDVLLSCLNVSSKRLPIEEFLVGDENDAVSTFLHPCERKIMQDIIRIINLMREVVRFTKFYGSNHNPGVYDVINEPEPLQKGFYVKALANGMEFILDEYCADIATLERNYLENPKQPLLCISEQLMQYEPLGMFLRKLIRGIRQQHLHGCGIIQYLHKNKHYGDKRICRAMKGILSSVNIVFLKQLTHWMLYAKLIDCYNEFFIQCVEVEQGTKAATTEQCSTEGKQTTVASLSDVANSYTAIWHYEICHAFLPHYFPISWAEKVLFIGRTVLMFKSDSRANNKSYTNWYKSERNVLEGKDALWNEKEQEFFSKIQALQNDEELHVSSYERVVDEIKTHITTRLSEIAINQADLEKQLHVIKDFYLLGRGELFLEFIRLIRTEKQKKNDENKMHTIIKAFESAVHSVGVSDDLERFSLYIQKCFVDEEDTSDFGYLQYVELRYKIHWPLHLLFSPKALGRYNMLFRFLLLIKKMQYELHMVWSDATRMAKHNQPQNVKVLQLRNQLMFFIDNLQYYIQVDVLESQFSILLNTVHSKADFEKIQKAHSIFQANVLSLCFLLTDDDATNVSQQQTVAMESCSPVYSILNEIFYLCEEFCTMLNTQPAQVINKQIDKMDKRFNDQIKKILNMLTDIKHQSLIATPLSQLLLRLDFNRWFSTKIKREINE